MNNAVDALHFAFVTLVLALALSVAVYMITLARQTSEIVLRTADDTAYLSYDITEKSGSGLYYENRIVGFETIIPTLFKYNFERYTVIFLEGTIDVATKKVIKADPMALYDTRTDSKNWDVASKFILYSIDNEKFSKEVRTIPEEENMTYSDVYGDTVFAIDLTEENYRNEPWTINPTEIKKHLEALLFGKEYTVVSTGEKINYGNSQLNQWYEEDAHFIELVGHYTTNELTDEGDDEQDSPLHRVGNKTTSKTVIVYVHIPD